MKASFWQKPTRHRACRAIKRRPGRSLILAHAGSNVMIEIVNFLRTVAQRCTTLARQCPDTKTAHGLEELGVELMGKALEIEQQGD